jgi:hypothetical protein
MRNPAFILSDEQIVAGNRARGYIHCLAEGARVQVSGVKRDGSPRTYTGTLAGLQGRDSHEVVKIDTADGPKSMNVYNVRAIISLI